MSRAQRGRGGRGSRGGPPSQAKSLLKRSALEAGLDPNGNLSAIHEITRPPLYPDLTWHSSGKVWDDESERVDELVNTKRTASTVYLMNKQRELVERLQKSAHYVHPSQQIDVIRYGSKNRQVPVDVAVLESMGDNLAKDDRYIPNELLESRQLKVVLSSTKSNKSSRNLDELEQREKSRRPAQPAEDEAVEYNNNDDEDDDEIEDYTTNYYASEEESDGADGGEATF